MANKITEKEMYEQISNLCSEHEDVVEFCDKKIAALEKKSANAKAKAEEKKAMGDDLRDKVQALLTDELQTIDAITDLLGDEEISRNKVSYRLNSLVDAGIAEKAEVKVEGTDGKSRAVKAFKLAE